MTMLHTIELSDHAILVGLEDAPVISVNQRRLLGGTLNVQIAPVIGGMPLSLKFNNTLTLAQIEEVRAVAALGQPVTLIHHRGTFNFLITGVNVEPIIEYANPDPDDWYSGEIPGIAL